MAQGAQGLSAAINPRKLTCPARLRELFIRWPSTIDFMMQQERTTPVAPRNIFYAWQTDSDKRFNRYFIEDCLKRAIRKLHREDLSDLVIDRDTKNVPGMPDIGHTILEKIANSAVVVADLTIINPKEVRRTDERPVCNPNVLFELGYAFGALDPQVMVGVFNTTFGEIEELPFDLRPKRLMTYRLSADDEKAKSRQKLVDELAAAIKDCLGDTEQDQIHRNSQIHELLSYLRIFATEIGEWYGIETLRKTIQDDLAAAQELSDLLRRNAYSNAALGPANYIIRSIEAATTLELNEENWPEIKRCISSVAMSAQRIDHVCRLEPDQHSHDELVRRARAMPTELDGHVENLQNGQYHWLDLEKLSIELRKLAFSSLVPQHPQFVARLDEISLNLRRHVLRWAKDTPKKDEAIGAIRDIREQLAQLIDKYGLS